MIHALKIDPEFFIAVKYGGKTFEVRKNDRDFKVGDYMALNEYNAESGEYTRCGVLTRITYILDDERYCKDGFAIIGFVRVYVMDEYGSHPRLEV